MRRLDGYTADHFIMDEIWYDYATNRPNFKQRVKEIIMGKDKDKKQDVHKGVDGHHSETIINQTFTEAAPKQSQLLILSKIVEPNTRSEELPKVTTEAVVVRADAIDLVEPATYATDYTYQEQGQKPKGMARYDLLMFDAMYGRTYWIPQGTKPCVRVYISSGPDYLVEGDVFELKDRIDALEA